MRAWPPFSPINISKKRVIKWESILKMGSLGESKMWKIKRGSFSDRRLKMGVNVAAHTRHIFLGSAPRVFFGPNVWFCSCTLRCASWLGPGPPAFQYLCQWPSSPSPLHNFSICAWYFSFQWDDSDVQILQNDLATLHWCLENNALQLKGPLWRHFSLLQSEKALVYTIIKPSKSNVAKEKDLLTVTFPEISR